MTSIPSITASIVTPVKKQLDASLLVFERAERPKPKQAVVVLWHPFCDGFVARVNECDNVMSYHKEIDQFVGFTTTDISALQSMWGVDLA